MLFHSLFYSLLVILTNLLREHDSLVSYEKGYQNLEQKNTFGILEPRRWLSSCRRRYIPLAD
jgi:hypothetical protein